MDDNRFDRLVRSISAARSRREALRVLVGVSIVGLLTSIEEGGARRRKARHRSHQDKHHNRANVKGNAEIQVPDKGKGKKERGNGKNKKEKDKGPACANAGQTPKNGKRCCTGLVNDGSGVCTSPPPTPSDPSPSPRPCADTCTGCCVGETCITAFNAQQCGSGGAICAPCAACQRCDSSGQCVADPGQDGACCPAGICQGGGCVSGSCTCGSSNCPNGCCAGNICRIDSDSACGISGGVCTDCTQQKLECSGGTCICTTASCPGGCCDGNTCFSSDQLNDTHCGAGGICTNCTTRGERWHCQSGQCACALITCPPDTCGSIDNGCGSTTVCGPCGNTKPICVGTTCEACSPSRPCPSGALCQDDGSCLSCTVCANGCSFQTVQAAINTSSAGNTIYICPGTYNENITITRSVTLIGSGSGGGTGGTTLNGGGIGRVVTSNSGFNLELQNMRITGGFVDADDGAGICFLGDGGQQTLVMTNCVVTGNSASGSNSSGRGGGVFNQDGTLSMTNCSVLNNNAFASGGGIYTSLGEVTLDNSSVTGNWVTGNDVNPGDGGGIYNGGVVTLKGNSLVQGNGNDAEGTVTDRGGGIYNAPDSTLTLEVGTRVENNATTDQGGGLYNDGGTMTIADGAIVSDNTPNNCVSTIPVDNCSPDDPTP